MAMLSEVLDELRSIISGRSGIADGILPPVVFVTVNAFAGVTPAAWSGAAVALLIVGWRLLGRRPLKYALSGLFGTLLATVLAIRSGRAEDFFLPGIITGALTTVAILASLITRRPFVAYSSWVTRSWPIEWYWHPRVLPAYMAATWLWAGYFGLRTAVTWWFYTNEQTEALAAFRVASGWPGLVALLVGTYVIGRKRLVGLQGPSVEEFENEQEPPWTGQQNGF
jgi:hypothetical protein